MAEHVLEGTWEEIAEHAGQLSGRRVRLTILDETYPENGNTTSSQTKPTIELLAGLTGVIDSSEPSSNSRRKPSAYGDAVIEKFRKQGLKLP